jgi:hypothetical protein
MMMLISGGGDDYDEKEELQNFALLLPYLKISRIFSQIALLHQVFGVLDYQYM